MTKKQVKNRSISSRYIKDYCADGCRLGAIKMAGVWLILKDAEKSFDKRRKEHENG